MENTFLASVAICGLCLAFANGAAAQQPTAFQRVGSQNEKVQEFFPGSHRARPVMADFTNNGYFGLFYGGQDLGGSTGWYKKEILKDTRWGDQGDGRYVNPILNADYSDPDVIRVGEKYYMVCSEFHYMGMPVLESDDMVNWKIIGQVYDRIPFPKYDSNERYGGGSWAPSIRYHDGKYWVFFCSPDEGLFMSNAVNPAGPWSPLLNVKNVSGWEDPCPLWDDDGQAYIGRSQLGGGPIILHKMSADGTALLDDGVTVYNGPTAEGTKMFKKDGYYYISIPEGGVSTGWQTILRSNNISGPYEKKIVLEQGSTKVNGPHQGSLVDTPDGEWWFYHFQSKDPQGRIVHLQPVNWEEGWPLIGADLDGNGIGEPVKEWNKPATGKTVETHGPQTSDEFDDPQLAVQWQFNHNPVDGKWSLAESPGYLTIEAQKASNLRGAKNMFTQKIMGYYGEASTEVDCGSLANGQRAGLFCLGSKYNAIGVERKNGENFVYVEIDGTARQIVKATGQKVYLKAYLNGNTNRHQLYYSFDELSFVECESPYALQSRDWKGARVGIYSYNTQTAGGKARFNYFRYAYDGPGKYINTREEQVTDADWHIWNELSALVKNNGDGTFSLVQEYDANIQPTIWTNSVFFDYDNDGNLDLLIVGKGGDWRYPMSTKYVLLYRNLGEEGDYLFEPVYQTGFRQYCDEEYFQIVSVGDYDHDGYNDIVLLCRDDVDRSIDLYRNLGGTGKFELQTNALPAGYKPTANGSVMFGDVDNDGWLDIFHTGYSQIPRGIGLYKNMRDGTFRDITPSNMPGAWQSQSVLSDVNGDGTLDVLVTGHGDNWARYSQLYTNHIHPQTQEPVFTLCETGESGIAPINVANVLVADFNHDGRMDMVMKGYDGQKDLTKVYYQNQSGKFVLDGSYPLFSVKNGGINMGDIDGDGDMDIVIAGEKGSDTGDAYTSPVRIYENKPQNAGLPANEPPKAPASVNASVEDGRLRITWEAGEDDISSAQALRYNIYVRDNTNGKLWMMIPADPATGRVKVGTDLQTSLSSQVKEYILSLPESEDYTVGVQALDQSYAGSPFTVWHKTGSELKTAKNTNRWVQPAAGGFILNSDTQERVDVFSPEGRTVATGQTNRIIPIPRHGVYIANVNGSVFKVIR